MEQRFPVVILAEYRDELYIKFFAEFRTKATTKS